MDPEQSPTNNNFDEDKSLDDSQEQSNPKLKMKDFIQFKDRLFADVESFKKIPKEDFSKLVDSATKYRHSLMRVHEDGQRLVSELKKIGESDNNRFAKHFLQVHELQKTLNEEFDTWQRKLWDDFILPMMNLSNPEKEELQNFEKKTKGSISNLETSAKKILNERKKASRKGEDEAPYDSRLDELKTKYTELHKSFLMYKETRYSLWLRTFCTAMDWQRNYHTIASDLLNNPVWQQMMVAEPSSNVQEPEVVSPPPLPESSKSPSPQSETRSDLKLSKKNRRKSTYSIKRGTFRFKKKDKHHQEAANVEANTNSWSGTMGMKEERNASFVKYYFVLKPDKLLYFKNQHSAEKGKEPKGSFNLSRCSVNLHEGNDKHCFELQTPPTPVSLLLYFQCSSDKEVEEWMTALNTAIHTCANASQRIKEEPENTLTNSDRTDNTDPQINNKREEELGSGKSSRRGSQSVELTASKEDVAETVQDEWIELTTDAGEVFYYNERTEESVWEKPTQ